MKLQIVCLRDIKTDAHTVPQFVPHIEAWRRAISDAINRPDSQAANLDFVKHPEDFEAYHLGEWDDNTAEFSFLKVDPDGNPALKFIKTRLFYLAELTTPKN